MIQEKKTELGGRTMAAVNREILDEIGQIGGVIVKTNTEIREYKKDESDGE